MTKVKQPTQLLLGPVPAALIGCAGENEQNIITLAWVGVVNSSSPMISAAIRANRHSFKMIENSGEFTVNIPTADQVEVADICGTLSGKETDKFKHLGLTAVRGTLEKAPMIEECPLSMECKVEHTLELGSHTLFIGRVISSYVDGGILDEKGRIDLSRRPLLGFCSGSYLEARPLGLSIGYTLQGS